MNAIYSRAAVALFICFLLLSALPVNGQEQTPPEAIHCPRCGAEVVAIAKFCHKCGQQMPAKTTVQRPETPVPEETAVRPEPSPQPAPAEQPAVPTAKIVEQPAAQAAVSMTRAVSDSMMKRMEPLPEAGNKPMETEPSAAPAVENIQARTIYQIGMALYEQGAFSQAAERFIELQKNYPQSGYAEDARVMAKICRGLDAVEKKMDAKSSREKNSGSAFGAGFLGGLLSILVFVLLILGSSD